MTDKYTLLDYYLSKIQSQFYSIKILKQKSIFKLLLTKMNTKDQEKEYPLLVFTASKNKQNYRKSGE